MSRTEERVEYDSALSTMLASEAKKEAFLVQMRTLVVHYPLVESSAVMQLVAARLFVEEGLVRIQARIGLHGEEALVRVFNRHLAGVRVLGRGHVAYICHSTNFKNYVAMITSGDPYFAVRFSGGASVLFDALENAFEVLQEAGMWQSFVDMQSKIHFV
jgi:hypothetical protein